MPLNIAIVGGGIGGLAAAIGLARNGHKVTICERSTSSSEVGYAFRIAANSDQCLKYLGIDCQAGGAVSSNSIRMLNIEGQIVGQFDENQDTKRGMSVFAFRPQLYRQLMHKALESGVDVKFGVKVKSVDVQRTLFVLENEQTMSADLIIAADGVHSAVRPFVIDSHQFSPSATTGHNALRFMLSKSVVQNDPIMSSLVDENSRMFTWAGNDKRILVYPVDFDRQYNLTCTHPEGLSDKETLNDDIASKIGKWTAQQFFLSNI